MNARLHNTDSSCSEPSSSIGSVEQLSREEARRGVLRITLFTLLSNIGLAAAKEVTGVMAGSAALVSDAANSASDVVYGIVVMIGVRLAGREADEDHPYGHERFESVVAMFLGAVVAVAGLSIGFEGVRKIWEGANAGLTAPEPAALWVAAAVIVFKSAMFLFTRSRAMRYKSDILAAGAADHGSDVLGTFGGFVGIVAARLGAPIMDPVASLVIACLILKTGIEIFSNAIGQMTDRSAGASLEKDIRAVIAENSAVLSIDKVLTRVFGDRVYVDVEIGLPGDLSLEAAHDIAEAIHDEIEALLPQVKHCMVHVNPAQTG
jgi:cation diffusion facilitator family transporter